MLPAAASEPYHPLRVASLAGVLAAHAAAMWMAIAWSQPEATTAQAAVLAVSFITEAEPVPPEPLPPTPPKPVVEPKPRPLIATREAPPVADAIVVPPEPEDETPEPAEPIVAYTPAESAPADTLKPEPPRFDMAYLKNPSPPFPAMSRRLHEEGTVALLVRVSAAGEALSVEVSRSSGYSRLDDAARRAVKQWKFKPSKLGDEAVEGMALVPIVFSLKTNS